MTADGRGEMSDLISRQAAIDAINHICPVETEYDCMLLDRVDVRYVLSDLPSAQPQYEELTPEEAASEIASRSTFSAWYWLDDMIRLKQTGYAICRKR